MWTWPMTVCSVVMSAGGRLGVVMAAAVWDGRGGWSGTESASGLVGAVKGHVEVLGTAGMSVDGESRTGGQWDPLPGALLEERQQWKEEQQLQCVQQAAARPAGVGEQDAVGVQQDAFIDGEQQWLLPPVSSEPAV